MKNDDSSVFVSPEKKIDELLKKRQQSGHRIEYEHIQEYEPVEENDIGVVSKDKNVFVPKSEGLKKIFDNLQFVDKVKKEPVLAKKSYKGYTHQVMDLSHFLNLRLYPRSIYTTDKLLRLVATSKYEQLKRYIEKKRKVSMNFLYIILIIMGVVVAIVVILMLVAPRLSGGM